MFWLGSQVAGFTVSSGEIGLGNARRIGPGWSLVYFYFQDLVLNAILWRQICVSLRTCIIQHF
jgi:hypothetical protein